MQPKQGPVVGRWKNPKGPLVPTEIMADVEHIITLFGRDSGWNDLPQAVRSALPPIHHFSQILTDAWLVLQGDPHAAKRFRDALEIIEVSNPFSPGEGLRTEDFVNFFAGQGNVPSDEIAKETRTAPPLTEVVPLFHQAVLMLAAFHCHPDLASGARYATIVFGQLGQYSVLSALHRWALEALAGSENARMNIWSMLCLQGGAPSAGPPGPPIPHPPGSIKVMPPMIDHHPWPPFRLIDPCILLAAKTLRQTQNRYTVTDVTPTRACPGESITIHGTGFGDTSGKVLFRQRGTEKGSPPIEVAASTWTDTQITVVVPPNAGAGVELAIPIPGWKVCGNILQLFKQGEFSVNFGGGAPDIVLFTVNGSTTNSSIEAGQILNINWIVNTADHVSVGILDQNDKLLSNNDPAPATGYCQFTATDLWPTILRVRLIAIGKCNPPKEERVIEVLCGFWHIAPLPYPLDPRWLYPLWPW